MHLHFSGFSETRNMLRSGAHAWRCRDTKRELRYFLDKTTKNDQCQLKKEWREQHNLTWLNRCRETQIGVLATRCSGNNTISFAWKSHMAPTAMDERVAEEVRRRSRTQHVAVVYSVLSINALSPWGLTMADCAPLKNSTSTSNRTLSPAEQPMCDDSRVSDAWRPSQSWRDVWEADTRRLFGWLRDELGPHACVV